MYNRFILFQYTLLETNFCFSLFRRVKASRSEFPIMSNVRYKYELREFTLT